MRDNQDILILPAMVRALHDQYMIILGSMDCSNRIPPRKSLQRKTVTCSTRTGEKKNYSNLQLNSRKFPKTSRVKRIRASMCSQVGLGYHSKFAHSSTTVHLGSGRNRSRPPGIHPGTTGAKQKSHVSLRENEGFMKHVPPRSEVLGCKKYRATITRGLQSMNHQLEASFHVMNPLGKMFDPANRDGAVQSITLW